MSGIQKLPVEILLQIASYDVELSALMQVNKLFLEIFAPLLYEKIHGFLSVMTTEHVRRTLKYVLKCEHIAYSQARREVRNPKRFLRSQVRYRLKQALATDYRFLTVKPAKRAFRWTGDQRVTFVEDYKSLEHICTHIINNEESILKRFIKKFSVDLLFLDRFQTQSHGIISPFLRKYSSGVDGNLSRTHISGFQAYNKFGKEPFDWMDLREAFDSSFWLSKDHFLKGTPCQEILIVSKFLSLFLEGERSKINHINNGEELKEKISPRFDDFRFSEAFKSRLESSDFDESVLQEYVEHNTVEKERMQIRFSCMEEIKKLDYFAGDNEFAANREVKSFMDSIVKATTQGGSNGLSTSLMVVSNQTRLRNAKFVVLQPKVLLLNKGFNQ